MKGLILYALLATRLPDALHYMAGEGAFSKIREIFDSDRNGTISEEEFEIPERRARAGFAAVTFSQLDADGDGSFTSADFLSLRKPLIDAIDEGRF